MEMDFGELRARIKTWQEQESARRLVSQQRLVHLQPLREAILRRIVVVCFIALPVHNALVIWAGVPLNLKSLAGTLFLPAASLLVSYLSLKLGTEAWRAGGATGFLLLAVVFAAAAPQAMLATSGGYSHYGGIILITIILSGLLIGEFYVGAWTLICCASFQFAINAAAGWRTNLEWSMVYIAAAWLVAQFSRHLERLHEMSRTAEEKQRSSIVAERTRFAREIHGTLLEGFARITDQLSEAELKVGEHSDEARAYIENARKIAAESLVEARRTISSLHSEAFESRSEN
jgi:signal transduction histidine kinase